MTSMNGLKGRAAAGFWLRCGLVAIACLAALAFGLSAARAQQASQPAGEASASPKVERIILVFKTHFDIGYTDMAVNIVQRYRTEMIDKALAVCDQTRDLPADQQFAWTVPGWPMTKILEDWPGQSPERKQRVLTACKQGRFVIHALPFTTHTELLELEDLVRGMGFASKLCREMGLPLPRDAKMTDVPCHSWVMPTLLKNAGVDFLHIGCNGASSSPDVPMLFWWEGPDGSRLLTMYAAGGYGTGITPPRDWPHRTWLGLIHTGDNQGPPTPEQLSKLQAQIRQEMPQVKVQIGRLSDFADAILSEKPELPVVRADMPDTWIHGPMCDPIGAKIARNIRPEIATTEALHAQLQAWGIRTPDMTNTIASAYEHSLLYGEHTWGGALYWITKYTGAVGFHYGDTWKKERTEGRFDRQEASWREHTGYIETARDLVTPVLEKEMNVLAEMVNVDGPRIVVYNPLPYKRSGFVAVRGASPGFAAVMSVPDKGLEPADAGHSLGFVARDVPPMGYRTYAPVVASSGQPIPLSSHLHTDAATHTVESEHFKITCDPAKGTIRSLVDKTTGRELVDPDAPQGLGQYLHEYFDAKQVKSFLDAYLKGNTTWAPNEFGKPNLPPADQAPYRALSPRDFAVRLEQTPAAVRAIMESKAGSGLPYAVTTTVTLYNDLDCVDLEVEVHNKPADPWPEAGWICLPFKVDQPRFQLERLGSIIDPAKDIITGANRHMLALNGGLAVINSRGAGVGMCAIDHPLVSLEAPGCWKYSKDFVPRKPWVYVNLFNNQWTTNFRFWNEGTWSSRVRLWPVEQYEPATDLVARSEQARIPLLAAEAKESSGGWPPSKEGLSVSREGVLVTAFGPNPDGPGTVLRLWELAGKAGACQVRFPDGLKVDVVQPVTLRGEPVGKPVAVQDGTVTLELKAFSPVSLLIAGQ
jgi:alpha-mannosidase